MAWPSLDRLLVSCGIEIDVVPTGGARGDRLPGEEVPLPAMTSRIAPCCNLAGAEVSISRR